MLNNTALYYAGFIRKLATQYIKLLPLAASLTIQALILLHVSFACYNIRII